MHSQSPVSDLYFLFVSMSFHYTANDEIENISFGRTAANTLLESAEAYLTVEKIRKYNFCAKSYCIGFMYEFVFQCVDCPPEGKLLAQLDQEVSEKDQCK